LIVTDGMPAGNRTGLGALTRRAALAGVAVHTVLESQRWIGVGARMADRTGNPWLLGMRNPIGDEPPEMFARLASATGGTLRIDDSPTGASLRDADGRIYPDPALGRPRTLVPLIQAALEAIRDTCAITFVPPVADGRVHNLDVFVNIPGRGRMRARAPSLYQAPTGRH